MAGFAGAGNVSGDQSLGSLPDGGEAALGERLRCGEDRVPAELWDRFHKWVCHRIRRKYKGLLPADMAEQVVLTAFSHALLHSAEYNPSRSSLASLLLFIADHEAADCCERPYMKARQLELALPPEQLERLRPRRAFHAYEKEVEGITGAGAQLREMVRDALAALPAGEREVLWADACSPDGHVSSTCLAVEQKVTPEAIRQRRRRGKSRLRAELRRLGVEKLLFR
ncbi:MAG: hypothetical protein ACREHD_02165 [Pirellulales bacterium]